jgi:hypothetical protein
MSTQTVLDPAGSQYSAPPVPQPGLEHAGDIAADALVILLRLPERFGGDA